MKVPLIVRKVVGHSMLPVLPPGTSVVGWRYFKKLKPGQVVIVLHGGKEKIKRVDQAEDNKVYVLGDHEDASTDSRHFGWLPNSAVQARVIWPLSKKAKLQ